ncbi:MAG: hypothetical protein ACMG6S_33025 [Byssovorax sp.]
MIARTLVFTAVALLLGLAGACGGVVLEQPVGAGGATSTGTGAGDPHACTAGFADCNGDKADGCEADLGSDAVTCGACDHDCEGSPCKEGLCEPVVLASSLYFATRIALDATRVYWTSAAGTVSALPLAGGAIATLASGQDDPFDLAVDAHGVYFTNAGANTVSALPLDGGPPSLLSDAGNPLGIVVRSDVVYFTDSYDKVSSDDHVRRVPLPGGPPSVVAATPGAWMLAVDDARAYWTDPKGGAVWSAPLGGGAPTLLASGLVDAKEIEVDADAAYVAALEATYRIPLAGGPPQALVWGAGRGLAIDATHVYVGAADGRVLRVAKTGGPALALARTELYASDIAVDDHHVYWIARSKDGTLVRTPK